MVKKGRERNNQNKTAYKIYVEGEKTEYQYFAHIKKFYGGHRINVFKTDNNVCKQIEKLLGEFDEYTFLVFDADRNDDIAKCGNKIKKYIEDGNIYLSNPKIEYWLASHFDKCDKSNYRQILEKNDTNYKNNSNNKDIDTSKYNENNIKDACENSEQTYKQACIDAKLSNQEWYTQKGIACTNLHKLIEHIDPKQN